MGDDKYIMHKIVVLVPFRNVGYYIIDCVNSLLGQFYTNYEVYLLDDASTDGTLSLIEEEFSHIHKVRNEKRLGALENIFNALVKQSINDEDIVVILDGDDYIFGEYAFHFVNRKHNSNILLTYGQYIDNYGNPVQWLPYSEEEFKNLRHSPWKASHLKTFKYKLFKAFLEQDPSVDNFKINKEQFYLSTYDQALMFPLMEIAGYENTAMIPSVIYCYRLHSNNDHATLKGREIQIESEKHIRNRKPLKRMF